MNRIDPDKLKQLIKEQDPELYERWYGMKELPESVKATYDLIAIEFVRKYPNVSVEDLAKLMQQTVNVTSQFVLSGLKK